jgi:acetolactate synthase-1/2/3 large subunit
MRHGGKILIDELETQGATTAFTVPGESFLAALDGLYDSNRMRTIICRQEGGAAIMAEAWGKMTGDPGICFVTRGPGAANAMSGLHIAQQDSTPMIMFLGLPGAEHEDREAFQEIDTKGVFSTFVKWSAVIRDTKRIPEYVSRAFHAARSGRPGPVVLGLPEDMLSAEMEAPDGRAARVAVPAPLASDMEALAAALVKAEHPLMIVGGPGWSVDIQKKVEAFAKRFDLPVVASFRCQDYIDNRHPNYCGHAGLGLDAKLADAIKSADLLLVMGARLGEITTAGYTLVDIPAPQQKLIHVHPSADELGSVYRPEIAISATSASFAAALEGLGPTGKKAPKWAARRQELRAVYEASLKPSALPGAVHFAEIVRTVSDILPESSIITNGAGNYSAFLHRHFQYKGYRTQLAPTSGSMGYGLPAAIAAKLAEPTRTVVNFVGDGCFMMTGQELATAVQYGLNIVTIIANNGMYGTIRMHQERHYPNRTVGTTLVNPDFAAYARAFGAHGETVERDADFRAAFERALNAGKPSIIEVKTDPEAITPRQTITDIRKAAGG